MHNVVTGMIGMFTWNNQISVKLPVQPYNDLFEKMTNNQMLSLKEKLLVLRDTLSSAWFSAVNELDPLSACVKLQKVFGHNFPIL